MTSPDTSGSFLRPLERLLGGWAFPAFSLALIFLVQAAMLGVLAIPPAKTGMGAFAEAFKVWCFGYDPATGSFEGAYLLMVVVNPLLLAAVIFAVWWIPLREVARERPRAFLAPAGVALGVVTGCALGLMSLEGAAPQGELPFPAEVLRTAHEPPGFSLLTHEGRSLDLSDLEGDVVLLTAVYASCGFTCPMIMGQTKRALEALDPAERARIRVVGITLDPSRDTPEVLARMAEAQGVSAPLFNLCTGPPDRVEALLDRLGVARRRDPATGIIDHANLFILVDRRGRIAYRLTLGAQQERWLVSALRLLVREAQPAG